jgi:RNA polymerase sigma-70 factor (ECF subfamily)
MATLGERLASGDSDAFAELYDACAARIHRWLIVRMGSRDQADDVLQETFVRLAKTRRNLRGVDSPTAYAFKVARREASHRRWWRRREQTRLAGLAAELQARDETIKAPDPDLAEWAAAALGRLRGVQREVVELKIYGHLTFREIAQVTGTPPGTVATRYRSAIKQLRDWMTREES